MHPSSFDFVMRAPNAMRALVADKTIVLDAEQRSPWKRHGQARLNAKACARVGSCPEAANLSPLLCLSCLRHYTARVVWGGSKGATQIAQFILMRTSNVAWIGPRLA